jgi:hypothetical protein
MDVSTFDPFASNQEYNPMGANYGNPMLNMLVHGMVGFNYTPRPESGQSVYESFIARQRSAHFMNLQRSGFMNNPLMSALGMSQSPLAGIVGRYAAQPDSMLANAMSPLIGGNPMAASMQLYAGLSGANVMGVFGRTGEVSEDEVESMMQALGKNFYNVQNYDDPVQRGVRSTVNDRVRQHVIEQAESGLAGRQYAESVGITGLEYDKAGKLTQESLDRINQLDVSRAGRSETAEGVNIRSLKTNTEAEIKAEVDAGISKLLEENNDATKKQLNDNLEDLIKKYGVATKQELDKIRNADGVIDTTQLKNIVDNGPKLPADAKNEINQGISKLLDEGAKTVKQKELNDNVEELVKKYGLASKDELDAIRKPDGTVDTTKLKNIVDTRTATDALDKPVDAREEIMQRTQKHIIQQAENGDVGIKYLKDIGIDIDKSRDFDETGKLTDDARRRLEQIDVTRDSETPGVPGRTQLINRVANKRLLRKDVDKAIQELETARGDDTKDSQERVKTANEDLKRRLIDQGVMTKEEVDKITKRDGTLNESKVREYANRGIKMDYLEKAAVESKKLEEVGYRFKGFNFEQSRGFKIEDFTSAFNKAAETRLIGTSSGVAVSDRMAAFSKNAGGALDAARSLFGSDKSGAELVSKINDLLGGATKDLSTADGSAEIEKILRDAKSTARVAGLSIETMLSIIESTKELAKNNPQLQFMSGSTSLQIGMKATQTAAALGAVMSSEDYRKAGGSQAIVADQITGTQEFMQSGAGTTVARLLAATKVANPEAYSKIRQLVEENGGAVSGRFIENTLMPAVMQSTGWNLMTLNDISSNKFLGQQALKDEDISNFVAGIAEESVAESAWQGFEVRGLSKEDAIAQWQEAKKKGISFSEFKNSVMLPLADEGLQTVLAKAGGLFDADFLLSAESPEMRKNIEDKIKRNRERDQAMAKEMASLNAPIVTQFVDALVSGEDFADSAQAIASIFATTDSQSVEVKQAMRAAQDAGIEMTEAIKEGGTNEMIAERLESPYKNFTEVRRAEMRDSITIKKEKQARLVEQGRDAEAESLGKEIIKDEEKLAAVNDLSKEEMVEIADTANALFGGSTNGMSEAKNMLAGLRKQRDDGKVPFNAEDEKRLRVLESMEAQGFLESADAFDLVASGKVQNFVPAAIKAKVDRKTTEIKDRKTADTYQNLQQTLETAASDKTENDQVVSDMLEYYKDKGGIQQAYQDFNKGGDAGYFTEENRKQFAKDGVGSAFSTAKDEITQIQTESAGPDKSPEDKGREDMKKMFEGLTKLLKEGNSISSALDGLRNAILTPV